MADDPSTPPSSSYAADGRENFSDTTPTSQSIVVHTTAANEPPGDDASSVASPPPTPPPPPMARRAPPFLIQLPGFPSASIGGTLSAAGSDAPPMIPVGGPVRKSRGPRGPYKKRVPPAPPGSVTNNITNHIHINKGADPELVYRVMQALNSGTDPSLILNPPPK